MNEVRLFRGTEPVAALDPCDRGLAYGDGVFETVLVHQGRAVWWDAHLQRLQRGCQVLGIAPPAPGFLRGQVEDLIAGCGRGVLKLIVTRGVGARGYAPSADSVPSLVLQLGDPPPAPPATGLRLRWCQTRLAIQPQLAGIKHLNRLEQVLARAEWDDPAIHEGLLCDPHGKVVAATAANVFVFQDGRWLTPPVTGCGVAGICRDWLLARVEGAEVAPLKPGDVEAGDAVILCNAVRGILPVAALGARRWAPGGPARQLVTALATAEPAFAAAH